MQPIITTKKDFPSLLSIINNAVDRAIEESGKDILYIDCLLKENNFKETRMYFDTYEEAKQWAKNNLGNFHPDMIKYL